MTSQGLGVTKQPQRPDLKVQTGSGVGLVKNPFYTPPKTKGALSKVVAMTRALKRSKREDSDEYTSS